MTEIFILILLILLNGIFVMSEIALVSARKTRLETQANKGDLKSKVALELAEDSEKFLSTTQIGITLIAILTGVYSGEKFGRYLQPYIEQIDGLAAYAHSIATTIVVVIVTFLSILFGELIPKKIGLLYAENIARQIARPMNALSTLMLPFVWVLTTLTNGFFKVLHIKENNDNAVTEEEIKAIISEGSESGVVEEDEKEIIERVFHLGDRSITSLMTHRTDIVWLEITDTVRDFKNKFPEVVYSSFPVCESSVDEIKGLVYVKDLVKADDNATMDQLTKPALFVPKNNKAYQLLEKFKETKIHSCFIVNEYGTLEGMITLNDILEAIVGDVPQTGQEEYEIVSRDDGSYLVDAQIHFYDFLAFFQKGNWEVETDFDTLAGFALQELNHIPKTGERFEWRGFGFEIIDMDGQRIDKILVTLSDELKDEISEED